MGRFLGQRVFLPPENAIVLLGHKPKPRGPSPINPPPAMTKNTVLALDIGKASAVMQLERLDATRCWRGKLCPDQAGWEQLQRVLAEHQVRMSELSVVVEATGTYHLAWTERLHQAGAQVHVLNPLLAARLASTANAIRANKTDSADVARLCEVGRLYQEQLGRFRYQSRPAQQGLRRIDHARAQIRKTLTNVKKCLQSHVELVFPALLAAQISPDTVRAAAILQTAPTAGAWLKLNRAQRAKLAGDKQDALDQACRQTLADEALAQACVPAMKTLLQTQQLLSQQLHQCEQDMVPLLPPQRVGLIASIPGFGERTAAVVATYLPEDFQGWGSRKKITARLQALFGCDPRLRQSGVWQGKVKISKRGIGSARTALFQAAFCSLNRDPENLAYYRRLRDQEKKDHKQAIVDVMRKQLRRLVAVLLNNQPFQPRSTCLQTT
jgi:transposase